MSGLYAKTSVINNNILQKNYFGIDELEQKNYYNQIINAKIKVAKIESIKKNENGIVQIFQKFVKGLNLEEFVFFDAIKNNKMTKKSQMIFKKFIKMYFSKIYPLKTIAIDCKLSNFMLDNFTLVDTVPSLFYKDFNENINTIKYVCFDKDLQIKSLVVYYLKYYIKYAYKNSKNRLEEIKKIFCQCTNFVKKFYNFKEKDYQNKIELAYSKRFEILKNIDKYSEYNSFLVEFLNNNFDNALSLEKIDKNSNLQIAKTHKKENIKGIYILGGTCAGKSYVSKIINDNSDYKQIDLDKVYWKDNFSSHCTKEEIVSKIETEIVDSNKFIIEGSYIKDWVYGLFDKCEKILVIKMDYKLQRKRVIKRFIKRKLGIEKSSCKETISTIKKLLKWTKSYSKNLDNFLEKAKEKYGYKIIIMNNSDEVLKEILMK